MADEIEEVAKMLAKLWSSKRDPEYPFWGNETVRFRKVVEGLIADDGAGIDKQMVADQFQIGDRVIYTPEGVVTRISGYLWRTSVDSPPSIMSYELECGVSVAGELLCRAPYATGGIVWVDKDPNIEGLQKASKAVSASMRAATRRS